MEREFTLANGVKYRVATEDGPTVGRVFISVYGHIVDVCINSDGIGVEITKGNTVVAEAHADKED